MESCYKMRVLSRERSLGRRVGWCEGSCPTLSTRISRKDYLCKAAPSSSGVSVCIAAPLFVVCVITGMVSARTRLRKALLIENNARSTAVGLSFSTLSTIRLDTFNPCTYPSRCLFVPHQVSCNSLQQIPATHHFAIVEPSIMPR